MRCSKHTSEVSGFVTGLLSRSTRSGRVADPDLGVVLAAVRAEWDGAVRLLHAVTDDPRDTAAAAGRSLHVDVVDGLAVAIVDVESLPTDRQERLDAKVIHFEVYTEERLDGEAVHPAGRAGVPGPAAAPHV